MQVTETVNEGLTREYKVVVPAADIDAKVDVKLAEYGKTINLPGFRPGKVPAKLLKQRFGKSVMGEVLETVVNESSSKTVEDNGLRPALQPKIEITEFDEGKDLAFDMKVEIMPEITPMDFATLELVRETAEVPEENITDALTNLAKNQGTQEAVEDDRASESGDILIIDFLGKVGGEAFEGGAAEDYSLELGSNTFIPGFEDQLIGKKVGEDVVVTVKFPEEYGAEELAGKDAEFECKVKEIKVSKPAELDDELAKKFGVETLDELKERIKADYGREYTGVSRQKLKRALLDALAEKHEFELPPTLVENELNGILEQVKQAREAGQEDEDTKGKSEDELKEEFAEIAQRRVKLGLLLAEVGRNNEIQITQDDLNKVIMAEAQKYPGQEKQVFEFYTKNEQALQSLQGPVYEEKVVDYILELAKVEDKEVPLEDLLKEDEEDA